MDEPTIVVNGTTLSVGEAMTMRVALASFASDLALKGLGDDYHGRTMTDAYMNNIKKINGYMKK
jgi:hypothetical protein